MHRGAVAALVLAVALAASWAEADGGPTEDAFALVAEREGASYAAREAITRKLVAMDDRAVAALVVAKRTSPSAGTRVWAKDTLEEMGRERADEQIRTRDPAVLLDVLRAFGQAHDPDALGVLSSFVGSDRADARDVARAALLAYGEDARTRIRQDFADLTGAPAPAAWSTEQVARALFAASDRIRLRDVYAMLDDAFARADAGDVDAAVQDFDAVLARKGELVNGPEAAKVYLAYALSIEDDDPTASRTYLEKALRLAGDPPLWRAAAELAVFDARELEARGVPADDAYRRALKLDPTNARARAALERTAAAVAARDSTLAHWTGYATACVVLLVAVVLFVGRRRQAGT